MLGENLKALRKQRGMSQEVMAQQLNVVRQTVSKWEQGLSVPDAQMLTRIAELFEVPVSSLLGEKIEEKADMDEIAAQLAVLNEQLAAKTKRSKRIFKILLAVFRRNYPRVCAAYSVQYGAAGKAHYRSGR